MLIVGCGFGGLETVRALSRAPVDITLVDRTNHHLFQPLLYQVATANVSAPVVSAPIRHILRREMQRGNLTVLRAEVTRIDAEDGHVSLEEGTVLRYDHLVVAAGATHSYFGRDEWRRLAPGLKTLADAFEIRSRIIEAFEHAERLQGPEEREGWLNFAVIGGGPTGVELAGGLVELFTKVLRKDFPTLDLRRARVVVVEMADRLLGTFAPRLSGRARRTLSRRGVEIMLGVGVEKVEGGAVHLTDGSRIPTRTLVWTAGVVATPLARTLGVAEGAGGRIAVAPDLSVPGHPEVFAVGDIATGSDAKGRPLQGVAQVAIQGGRHGGRMICAQLEGRPTKPFRYYDKGSMATIGRHDAVAELPGGIRLTGTLGWLAWLGLHLLYLIGFRNRANVLVNWTWNYLTYDRGSRIIGEDIDSVT